MNAHIEGEWTKPQRSKTAEEVRELIKEKHQELQALETELFNLEQGPRLEAIAKIRNIMRAHEITPDELQALDRRKK